jgi:hypothetical protein
VRRLLLAPAWLALAGCPAPVSDPPPPPSKVEIHTAPPRALGALAAGTDAAPKPDAIPPALRPSLPPAEEDEEPDAGAPTPGAPGSAAPPDPDAGMAL